MVLVLGSFVWGLGLEVQRLTLSILELALRSGIVVVALGRKELYLNQLGMSDFYCSC